jgi:hypothetical protein
MKYSTGEVVTIGDRVLADNMTGVVVCVIDDQQFSKEFPEFWAYLETGLLIESDEIGLVHYPVIDEDVKFIKRADRSDCHRTARSQRPPNSSKVGAKE